MGELYIRGPKRVQAVIEMLTTDIRRLIATDEIIVPVLQAMTAEELKRLCETIDLELNYRQQHEEPNADNLPGKN